MPRVTFLSRGPDDPKHQASGTVWLKHQHDRVCGDTMLQLQVDADPLASEGHCHRIFSFPGFLSSSSQTHSHLSLRSRHLGSLPFGPLFYLLFSCISCQVLYALEMAMAGSIFLSGPRSPKSWLSSLLHPSCSPPASPVLRLSPSSP